ncbi:MAG: hypothetical protein DYG89_04035 [Caldilinea sp. CFX5]|nr:hypothetical protein [Caldilinea sp. CFX5]
MSNNTNLLAELSKPFHPSRITWRPGALTGKKDKALALAYADLRAYQNRLDEVCGMDWSVSYTAWGDRIICHLTINGITRSSTGEADSDSERSEIAGTSAEAQAFKRACAMFSLGRYLYSLPSLWVEYDAPNQRFTEKSKARLYSIIAQHYQRFLNGQETAVLDEQAEERDPAGGEPTPPAAEPAPAAGVPAGSQATPPATPPNDEQDNPFNDLRDELKKTGKALFPKDWDKVEPWFITRWTTKNSPTNVRSLAADLTLSELEAVLAALVEHAPIAQTEWQKSKAMPPPRPEVLRRPNGARRQKPTPAPINQRF